MTITGVGFGAMGALASTAPASCGELAPNWLSQVGSKDAQILQAAQQASGGPSNFLNDLNALSKTVATAVPGGEVHLLGEVGGSPIFGSLVSRVGIAHSAKHRLFSAHFIREPDGFSGE
jgi:hypothetical protein